MTVDIIIPNYNGANLFEKNLPKVWSALQKYKGKIIVVDDGSKDSDKKHLESIIASCKKRGMNIHYVFHLENKGFSSAVNTGARESDAEFIVLLNSDVLPTEHFLENPLKLLSNDPKLIAVGCMDRSVEGEDVVLRGRGLAQWKNGFVQHSRGEVNASSTFWVSGGSSVFRRAIYQKLGGMDEIYNPFYWEDIDLSYRAQKAGYQLYFDKSSVVEHYHSEGAIKKNFKVSKVTTTAYRNQLIFIWKNISDRKLLASHFLRLPMTLLQAAIRRDKNLISGFILALLKLPAIIDKRQKQKILYKVADPVILNSFHE